MDYTSGAYRSAVAHPYHVSAYRSWDDHDPTVVGFQTEAEARSFAVGRPEPLIDLVQRDCGVIAARRLVPFMDHRIDFIARDDFPQPSLSPFVRRALARELPAKVLR